MAAAFQTYNRPKKPAPRFVPQIHTCAADFCGQEGCFGLGPPIQPQVWYCPAHLPDDYWTRGGAR